MISLGKTKPRRIIHFVSFSEKKNPLAISILQFCIYGTVRMWGFCYHSHPYLSYMGKAYHYYMVGCDFYLLFPLIAKHEWDYMAVKKQRKVTRLPMPVSILKSYIMLYFILWNSITFTLPVYEIWKVLCSPKKSSKGGSCYFNCWIDFSKNMWYP